MNSALKSICPIAVLAFACTSSPALAQHAVIGDHRIDREIQPAPPGQVNLGFGTDVDVSGNTALIGAPGDLSTGVDIQTGSPEGRVSIRSRHAGGFNAWGETGSLLPQSSGTAGGRLGLAVALSGSLAVVSSAQEISSNSKGEVYLFDVNTGASSMTLRNTVSQVTDFGRDVDTDGTTVIVGAQLLKVGPPVQFFHGVAYLYDTAGNLLHTLSPSDGSANWDFGASVAVDGAYAVVGATGASGTVNANAGAVYVFDVATGAQLHKLTAANGAFADKLGNSVAVHGARVLAGAPNHGAASQGGAYLFNPATGAEIMQLDGEGSLGAGSAFGWSVALSGDRAYVGAISAFGLVNNVSYVGRTYAFDLDYDYAVHWYDNPDATDFSPSALGNALAADGNTLFDGSGAATAPGTPVEQHGRAFVSERRDLGFGIDQASAPVGGTVEFSVRGGAAGALRGFGITAVNGVPIPLVILVGPAGIAPLDAMGQSVTTVPMPTGVATPVTVTVVAGAISKSGALAISNTRDLLIL